MIPEELKSTASFSGRQTIKTTEIDSRRKASTEGLSPLNPLPKDSAVNKKLEAEAQAVAVRCAHVQALEACSTGTLCAIQTGPACEGGNAEADKLNLADRAKQKAFSSLIHTGTYRCSFCDVNCHGDQSRLL